MYWVYGGWSSGFRMYHMGIGINVEKAGFFAFVRRAVGDAIQCTGFALALYC